MKVETVITTLVREHARLIERVIIHREDALHTNRALRMREMQEPGAITSSQLDGLFAENSRLIAENEHLKTQNLHLQAQVKELSRLLAEAGVPGGVEFENPEMYRDGGTDGT